MRSAEARRTGTRAISTCSRTTHGLTPSRSNVASDSWKADPALAEAKDRYLRLAADFENYKRRTRQEQIDTIQHASTELIARLLPALDDLRSVK